MPFVDKNGPYFISRTRGTPDTPRDLAASVRKMIDASKLRLIRVAESRDGEWSADDYDVFDGHQHVGRIALSRQAPQGMPWFWAITARPESEQNRGFAVSCEQAMRELRARWANPSKV
jgi:hypothetical protein